MNCVELNMKNPQKYCCELIWARITSVTTHSNFLNPIWIGRPLVKQVTRKFYFGNVNGSLISILCSVTMWIYISASAFTQIESMRFYLVCASGAFKLRKLDTATGYLSTVLMLILHSHLMLKCRVSQQKFCHRWAETRAVVQCAAWMIEGTSNIESNNFELMENHCIHVYIDH